ncbi:uncharacterized protein VNE69_09174 [Vairimorpha necatrix]|uniref:Uncharacterized protein n=1 Tax=Vairimorpha necatrix TaxID=6039 RepID=A0AAX4JFH4_9MICR
MNIIYFIATIISINVDQHCESLHVLNDQKKNIELKKTKKDEEQPGPSKLKKEPVNLKNKTPEDIGITLEDIDNALETEECISYSIREFNRELDLFKSQSDRLINDLVLFNKETIEFLDCLRDNEEIISELIKNLNGNESSI